MKTKQLSIAALALAAALTACNSGSKNQTPDGWVIKNDVWKVEDIDFDEIAEVVDIKPIATDEPIAELRSVISGNSNDFIASEKLNRKIFYHIVDGRMTEKLAAEGNGPNEYLNLRLFSYLPSDSLLYGYDTKGQIMCFKTSPFKFVSKYTMEHQVDDMFVLDRDTLLLSLTVFENETYCGGVYKSDGKTLTKMIESQYGVLMMPAYVRTDGGVLMSVMNENSYLYRYSNGQMSKIATIDYGDMSKIETFETVMDGITFLNLKDNAIGCRFVHLNGSTLAYWQYPLIEQKRQHYLTIATREQVQNYKPHIGGTKIDVFPGLIDNGVYTMLIQGDWESKINADEELSETGKRIIEAMKGNDYNPVILQFKLKTM